MEKQASLPGGRAKTNQKQDVDPITGALLVNPDGTPKMINGTMPEVIGII